MVLPDLLAGYGWTNKQDKSVFHGPLACLLLSVYVSVLLSLHGVGLVEIEQLSFTCLILILVTIFITW